MFRLDHALSPRRLRAKPETIRLIAWREVALQLRHAHQPQHIRPIAFEDERRASVMVQTGLAEKGRIAQREGGLRDQNLSPWQPE